MPKLTKEETLIQQYKTLTQSTNKRLYRLEQLQKKEGFENVTKWSYANAMQSIKETGGINRRRFPSALPYTLDKEGNRVINEKLISRRIKAMQEFQSQATSTKSGITKVYSNRAKTINERYGTNFTWQELAQFYESKSLEKTSKKYGSDVFLKAIGKIQKYMDKTGADEFTDDIRKTALKNLKVDDEVVNDTVHQLLLKNSNVKLSKFI